jgi:endonuclease-3
VSTETPEETEEALMKVVERKYWSMLNRVVVNHGQRVCQPVSPRCSECAIAASCPRTGVVKYR